MGLVMRKYVMSYANNKGAHEPAHPCSLISIFVVQQAHLNLAGKELSFWPTLRKCICIYCCCYSIPKFIIWAASWQNQRNDCAPSEDSDQPGHLPCLIRVFAILMMKAWTLSYPLSTQWRLRSDWADAQTELSLCWAHMPLCWFCHEAAHFYITMLSLY